MPHTNNGDIKLFWTEQGAGDPVLLIMGLSFTHEMWFRTAPPLARHYRVILFDNRGMGRSDVPPGPYRMAHMASDAAAVLDAAGVESAHVIGASMGGMIAQELALNYPARVRSLLLGCTSHGGILARWPRLALPRNTKWSTAVREERELAWVPILYSKNTPPERIEEDILIRTRCNWSYRGFMNQLAAILVWSSYRRLPRITVPTLVVHGDSDRLVPVANGRIVAARIPGAQFRLVPDAGHILTTDQPEICQELMLDFVQRSGK